MTPQQEIKELEKLRIVVITLQLQFPEILDSVSELSPESKLQRAYCELLWQIDERKRAVKNSLPPK